MGCPGAAASLARVPRPSPAAAPADKPSLPPPPLNNSADYISFIRAATPNHSAEYMQQLKRFNMGAPGESDCPVFDGMYEYFSVRRAEKGTF